MVVLGCAIGPVAAVVAVANDDRLLGSTRPVLWLLLAGAVVILAICAANVATLLLVRATATQHESAVRSPLGPRGRGCSDCDLRRLPGCSVARGWLCPCSRALPQSCLSDVRRRAFAWRGRGSNGLGGACDSCC